MENRKPGDVIIFEAGDDWISKCIAKLTNSTVSHAAMLMSEDTMVEMGAKGIVVDGCSPDDLGELTHFLRLTPEQDPAPLIKAAQSYLSAGVKFDYPDLLLLAGMLVYRGVRPTPRWKKITDLILQLACWELDKLLNRLIHKGEKVPVMICSQLVYQCYRDCGKDYELVLENALLQGENNAGSIRLVDLIQEENCLMGTDAIQIPINTNGEILAEELYAALIEAEAESDELLLTGHSLGGTVASAAKLLDLVEQILEKSGVALPVYALFVTPCDLLQNTTNLKQYDAARITRVRI